MSHMLLPPSPRRASSPWENSFSSSSSSSSSDSDSDSSSWELLDRNQSPEHSPLPPSFTNNHAETALPSSSTPVRALRPWALKEPRTMKFPGRPRATGSDPTPDRRGGSSSTCSSPANRERRSTSAGTRPSRREANDTPSSNNSSASPASSPSWSPLGPFTPQHSPFDRHWSHSLLLDGPRIPNHAVFTVMHPPQRSLKSSVRPRRRRDSADSEPSPRTLLNSGSSSGTSEDEDPWFDLGLGSMAGPQMPMTYPLSSDRSVAFLVYHSDNASFATDGHSTASQSNHARYLPLIPYSQVRQAGWHQFLQIDHQSMKILPSHKARIDQAGFPCLPSNTVWPKNNIPVELFELIAAFLPRDDVKTMRLINREFEQKVSRSLFISSVVPFNTELYDMIDEHAKQSVRENSSQSLRGRQKISKSLDSLSSLAESGTAGLQWQNATEDAEGKVYTGHGLSVFRGFGPHVRHFGMSFEVTEDQLVRISDDKQNMKLVPSYHGTYEWPNPEYARFATLDGLERRADDTSRMKVAFSHLTNVQELALSIDNGLGWLNGPDISLHARLFRRPTTVFGRANRVPDHAEQEAHEFWAAVKEAVATSTTIQNEKEVEFQFHRLADSTSDVAGLCDTKFANPDLWSSIDAKKLAHTQSAVDRPGLGILALVDDFGSCTSSANDIALVPRRLQKHQKEWLLETEWAQRAFLESWMLAIVDNPNVFHNVTCLKFAKISAGFLPLVSRKAFWRSLPALKDLTFHVSPDFHAVTKDDAGHVVEKPLEPSAAVQTFFKQILWDHVASRRSIKRLNIGWVGGGEHADGMFARNKHLLAAPVTQLRHSTDATGAIVIGLKHVEHLTLTNCWITPVVLERLVIGHRRYALKKLTLDSVSLTAHPGYRGGGQHNHPFFQALMVMQAQVNQIPVPQNAAQTTNSNNITAFQQQVVHQLQQIQQIFNPHQVQPAPPAGVTAPTTLGQGNSNLLAAAQQQQATTIIAGSGDSGLPSPIHWTQNHRCGSWPWLLDRISPDRTLVDFHPSPSPAELRRAFHRKPTNLHALEFISCGYARHSNHDFFDQSAFDATTLPLQTPSAWFSERALGMINLMLEATDPYLAHIVQWIPPREVECLLSAWGMETGWADKEKAEEAEYDGILPGGTGRFSGRIEKSDGCSAEGAQTMRIPVTTEGESEPGDPGRERDEDGDGDAPAPATAPEEA